MVLATIALARPLPQLVSENGRQTYITDGKPLLTLAAKGENSSAESRTLKGRQEARKELEVIRTADVIFVPTPQDVVDKMLELAEVKEDDLVYDLGCGDGRIVVTVAKKYGSRCVGYDIDPQRVKESLENVEKNNVGHLVQIEQQDIFYPGPQRGKRNHALLAKESEYEADPSARESQARLADCLT